MEKLQGQTGTTIHMQNTFMRKQIKGRRRRKWIRTDISRCLWKTNGKVCKAYCALHSIDKRCTNEIKWQQPVTDMIRNFVSQNIINLWSICDELLWGQISRNQRKIQLFLPIQVGLSGIKCRRNSDLQEINKHIKLWKTQLPLGNAYSFWKHLM